MSRTETLDYKLYMYPYLFPSLPNIKQVLRSNEEIRRLYSLNRIGDKSVNNVCQALRNVNGIGQIKVTEPNSPEDHVGKDIVIRLTEDINGVDKIGIQVKSSFEGIIKFLNHFDKKNADNAWKKIIQKKLIVLNGQLTDEAIVESFNFQLDTIIQYHKTS